jgi:hypothetical protein
MGMAFQLACPRTHVSSQSAIALEYSVFAEDLQARERCGAGEGIAGEAV